MKRCTLNKQKSLTDFFKQYNIQFSRVSSKSGDIITITGNFPRLCFRFEPEADYVTVWKVSGDGYINAKGEYISVFRSYSFPCQSPYRLMAKLLMFRLIMPGHLKRLKL